MPELQKLRLRTNQGGSRGGRGVNWIAGGIENRGPYFPECEIAWISEPSAAPLFATLVNFH